MSMTVLCVSHSRITVKVRWCFKIKNSTKKLSGMWLDLLIQNASKHDITEIIPLTKGDNGRCHRAESGRIGVEPENMISHIRRNNRV